MENTGTQKSRPVRACAMCHEKKIRCDLAQEGAPCSNCRSCEGVVCRPHQRKRKRQIHESSPGSGQQGDTEGPNNGLQLPAPTPPSSGALGEAINQESPESSRGYLGRAEYLGINAVETHAPAPTEAIQSGGHHGLSPQDKAALEIYQAFHLPPTAARRSLVDSFRAYCAPWMPVVEDRWLRELDSQSPSLLLSQSILLAGSRVAAAPYMSESAEQYYRRAKALFFSGHDRNPIIQIASACLLNWWNPSGPDQVSLDGSSFWLRVAVSLAYQVGLHREPPPGKTAGYRRRLWWALVARDCQLSSAHGRPRAISLSDSNVSPPSVLDFGRGDHHAELFVAFVKICAILGDVTESYLRHQLCPSKRQEIRNALYCWVKELPGSLCLFPNGKLSDYSFNIRSLHVPYFVVLTILYRTTTLHEEGSVTVSAVAGFFLCGIFEEFLIRGDLRFLGPIFKFYVFAAGMALVNAQAYFDDTVEGLGIIKSSLYALAERYPSAKSNIRILDRLTSVRPAESFRSALPPLTDQHEALPLFQTFGPEICRLWHLVDRGTSHAQACGGPEVGDAFCRPPDQLETSLVPVGQMAAVPQTASPDGIVDPNNLWSWQGLQLSGNWLLPQTQDGSFGDIHGSIFPAEDL